MVFNNIVTNNRNKIITEKGRTAKEASTIIYYMYICAVHSYSFTHLIVYLRNRTIYHALNNYTNCLLIAVIFTKVCCARMADFRRKFNDAARRYIHLSYEPAIHPSERLQSLRCASVCAILSQAG